MSTVAPELATRPGHRPTRPRRLLRRLLVISGTLTEHTIATRPGGAPRLVGDSLQPGAGRSFGPRHIHQITNTGVRPAVSLHVYGPALHEMTRYRIDDGRLLVAAIDRAGTDW